uniref:PH domain-containing protein n=1 Tax=Parastrongyloides trichosuri TaxID=131310 RepID=A0A0N4ZF39_PARTI
MSSKKLFFPCKDLTKSVGMLENNNGTVEISRQPTQKEIDDVMEILAASADICEGNKYMKTSKSSQNVNIHSPIPENDVHNDTATKNARTFFMEREKIICSTSNTPKFTFNKKSNNDKVKKETTNNYIEISNMNKKNIPENSRSLILAKSSSDTENRQIIPSPNLCTDKRKSYSSFFKNTPPTTPSEKLHSDAWTTFDPSKVRTISETRVNNILSESMFLNSPERNQLDSNKCDNGRNQDPISKDKNVHRFIQNGDGDSERSSFKNGKFSSIRNFFSKFESPKSSVRNIQNNQMNNDHVNICRENDILIGNVRCSAPQVIGAPDMSLPREFNTGKKVQPLYISSSRTEKIGMCVNVNKDSNFQCKFNTPKLTAYQKKIVDENCAPKYSPAPKFTPDAPFGKVMMTYKTETLSIASASGTLAIRSAAQGIPEFKPMAHSTPFPTPKQSFGLPKKRNESRSTILPFDERSKNSGNTNSPKGKESFLSNASHVPSLNAPSCVTQISEEMYVRKLTVLKNLIRRAKDAVCKAQLVINDCSKKSNFNGSTDELTAHRTMLIASKKIESLKLEYERTKTLMNMITGLPRINSNFLSKYTLNDIKLELNRLFCFKKIQTTNSYAFCIVTKCANNVIGTQIRTVEDIGTVRLRQVKFSEVIKFSKLPIDFVVVMEIYAIKIGELDRTMLSRIKKGLRNLALSVFRPSAKRSSLTTIDENATPNPNDSLHPSNQIGFERFTQCGVLRLNRDTTGNQKFFLDEVKFPLEGTICINAECSILPQQIEMAYSGYLYVYSSEDLKKSIVKMWTIVKRSIMKFWNDCDDEYRGLAPSSLVDMSKITSPVIERIKPNEIGFKPDSFYIDLVCEPTATSASYQQKRIFFSCECSDDCDNWLQYLNDILRLIRFGSKDIF